MLNEVFLKMCQEKIPDPMFAQEYALRFSSVVPQFNEKTKIVPRSFSGTTLQIAEIEDDLKPVYTWQKRKGIVAVFFRLVEYIFQSSRWKRHGWVYGPSPYLPPPKNRSVKVQSAAWEWQRSLEDMVKSGNMGFDAHYWRRDSATRFSMLVRIYYAYDAKTDTLYIDYSRDWLDDIGPSAARIADSAKWKEKQRKV